MEEQENQEKQEQDLGQEIVEAGKKQVEQAAKDAAKKAAKEAGKAAGKAAKQAITKAILPILPYILIAVVVIIVGVIIAGGLFAVFDKIKEIGQNAFGEIAGIMKIGDNGPVAPSVSEILDTIDKRLEENGLDKANLYLGNENQANAYLYKFMSASLSTQLPYIKDSTAETIRDIALYINPITGPAAFLYNYWEKETDVQGIVKIKRNTAGKTKDLDYKKYEDFSKLIEENNNKALEYFSIDDSWQLCVAKYTKTTVEGSEGKTTTYSIDEVKIPYQTMISQYSIPFEFFIVLQQITQNPEYVSAVADLISDQGEIELTIFDSTEIITTEYTYEYDLNKIWVEEKPVEQPYEPISNETNTIDTSTETIGGGIRTVIQSAVDLQEQTTQDPELNNNNTISQETTTETKLETKTSVDEDQKETTTTVNEINSITAQVTKANVWVIAQEASYAESSSIEYPLGEDGLTTEIEDEKKPETPTQTNDTKEWKTNQIETTKETVEKYGCQIGESNVEIDADSFLRLWKNALGVEVKYRIPSSIRYESPIQKIYSAEEMLYSLLENSESTQTHAQLMRYLIHLYKTGKELDIDLSIFNTNEFTGIYYYGSSTAKEFIHYFEGTPKQTQDGQYVVFDDGAGNLTVGWGIAIDYNKARFAARGVNASTLKVGSTVDKTIVDSIEDEIIEEIRNYVIDVTQGLNLEEYQIDALVSRCYNCGTNGGMSGFVKAYTQYGNTEELYTNLLNKPVTSNGKYLAGLETRRKAEWNLFNSGYYINTNSYYSPASANSSLIVQKAKECHDYLRLNGYKYVQAGVNIPISSSVKTIDCSSYVSWVLYEAGFKEFAGYQKTSSYFLKNPMNWEKITSIDKLQPGDILVYTGHVQIYAGDGKYYNCGGDKSIQHEAPSAYGTKITDSTFQFGLRPTQ